MAGVPGRSGRKPKPTGLKEAAGNPGKRELNLNEPDFGQVHNIDCPEWMDGHSKDLWEHLAPLLCGQKIMQATDIQNLEAYCAAYGRFRLGEESVKNDGIVVEGAQGGSIKNPAVTVINEALRQMASYGGLLGLDPSSRQRLKGPEKPGGNNPFAALLN